MADIFISYARADRDTARTFADAFLAHGWTVWWDPEIFYATQYDKVIEDELAKAKCIVVLWSKRSVGSRWVRSEASYGVERQALVPVRIEAGAEVPLEFTKTQTAELAGWDGDREHSTFEGLVRGIERVIRSVQSTGQEGARPPVAEQRRSALTPRRRMRIRLGLLAAPTLIGLLLAAIAMRIHRPTAFDLDLTVSKVSVVSAAEQAALLIDKTPFTTLTLHGIEKGEIKGERAQLVQAAGNVAEGEAESVARTPLPLPVAIAQRQTRGATVMFGAPRVDAPASGELDRLFLAPGARVDVAVTMDTPPALSVRVHDQPSRIVLSLRGDSDVELVDAKISPAQSMPIDAATMTLQVGSAESGSLIELVGTASGPTLLLTPSGGTRPPVALVSDLRVSGIEFAAQGPTGAAVTTVSGEGTIGFPGTPDKAKIAVTDGHYVVLGDPRNFFLRKLVFQPDQRALRLEAGGVAGSLRSGPVGRVEERALTWFDSIWHQPWVVQLFALAAWLLPTTLAGYRLFKELRP